MTRLWEICTEMIGEKFSLEKVDAERELSPYYVDIGGKNLAYASTGTRLLLMLVAACLDENCSVFLIDEPEIGLSPKMQTALAKFLLDIKLRTQYFPHIKQLFVATHSHIFLDRTDISNNFTVQKTEDIVKVTQVDSISNFHDLQFNMLGNDLQTLFLPEVIIIVEGISDNVYIQKIFSLHYPDKRISVVKSEGEGNIKEKLYVIDTMLGGLMKSPYKTRIFVLLDKKHSNRKKDFTKYGLPEENVITLNNNGIEYYYPEDILCEIYSCGSNPLSKLEIQENAVNANGIELSKKILAEQVRDRMTISSVLPNELIEKLLKPVGLLFDGR